jgi:hypothetical protein
MSPDLKAAFHVAELMGEVERLQKERDELLAALLACEVVMDTAAFEGVGEILSPTYRETWAAAHIAARELLAKHNHNGEGKS